MSKNGFGVDASDWENFALRTAPASLQNFKQFQTGRRSAFCLSWKPLGPSWGRPAHERPENGSFSNVLCQRFNSRIAAVKIRFSELFQAFAKSISALNQALLRSQATKTAFRSFRKAKLSLKCRKTASGSTRPTGKIVL